MKSYLDLVNQYEKVHKKKNRITILCVVIAVCLVTAIFGMADMEIRAQKIRQINEGGNWHISLKNITKETSKQILKQYASKIAVSGWMMNLKEKGSVVLEGEKLLIGSGDGDIIKEFGIKITRGRYPENKSEIAIDSQSFKAMGLTLGETYSFLFPSREAASLTVTGTFERNSNLLREDTGAVLFLPELVEQYFKEEEYEGSFTIQLKDNLFMKQTIQEMIKEYQITEENYSMNQILIGLSGQSNEEYLRYLYSIAMILFVFVLTAGVLMISSSLHMNITERIQFFGMLRCLGATKAQVRRFVIKESLRYSFKGIPAGIAAGTIISWGLCAYLKYFNGAYFSDLPLFGISVPGIISGVCIGLFSVLLASMAPCKKAVKVSPLNAVNANISQRSTPKVSTNAKTKFFRIEYALGISHAAASKKNLLLLAGSFAISIILFLSFSVAVEFMNCAITTLKPWTPDISIYGENDQNEVLEEKLCRQINKLDGVKKTYGRMYEPDIPAEYQGRQYRSNLISYEENQFDWSEGYLLEGDLKSIRDGDGFLVTYDSDADWKLNDTLALKISGKDKQIKIKGILSESPFKGAQGELILICSEKTFRSLTDPYRMYTIFDIQLNRNSDDKTAAILRNMVKDQYQFSDRRLDNKETQSAYYSFAVFIYGFLVVIASITVFSILNSMNMSITVRIRQYGAMRAVGMSEKQVRKMVMTEACVYAFSGCILGIFLGLICNHEIYHKMITYRWGTPWTIPVQALFIIVFLVIVSALISIIKPLKKIKEMDIISTISAL